MTRAPIHLRIWRLVSVAHLGDIGNESAQNEEVPASMLAFLPKGLVIHNFCLRPASTSSNSGLNFEVFTWVSSGNFFCRPDCRAGAHMSQHCDVVLVDGLTADAQLGEQGVLIQVIHIYCGVRTA